MRSSGSEERKAMATALRILGRRFESRRRLMDKLAAGGFSPGTVKKVAERLAEWGYLDDRKQGMAWAESRALGRREGPLKIRSKLKKLRVGEEDISAIVDRIYADKPAGEIVAEEIFSWCRRRGVKPDGLEAGTLRRLINHLKGRGFQEGVIWGTYHKIRRELCQGIPNGAP